MIKQAVSYGIINDIDEYNINHYCCIESGSSGSPIINLLNNKIIGIHKEGSLHLKINKGIYLKYPINEFINKYNNMVNIKNEIEIELKVDKYDINKNIYFLDNIDYIEDKSKIKHYHDNLKELNELNTDLYINDKKYKYEKYFKPDKEGIYKIKLIFKINIKDCSFMFGGCKNIININFKNFNSKNVINMRYMFKGCINIENLYLSSFNTENVIEMEEMFGKYNNIKNLKDIDFSFFDIMNSPKDFKEIIYYNCCYNLTNLNLSSFNTKNVTNMSFMFHGCDKLTNLNLSSFDTKNVTNMSFMFYGCNNLNNLNLSSFDTKNVTKVEGIFAGCNISTFNLSSFEKFDKEKMIN